MDLRGSTKRDKEIRSMSETKTKKPRRTAEQLRKEQLNKAANKLVKMAKEGGVEQNFFFQTTFERYEVQLQTLERLRAEIENGNVLISKEYVKGRQNTVVNPAISEYNKTSTAANQTATTLIRIIKEFAEGPVMNTGNETGDCDL